MSPPAQKSFRERFAGIWQYVPGGALLFAIVPLILLSYLGWFYYGAKHLDQALYALTVEHLTVTPQPAWISTSNVREEVFQRARLDRISLLDPRANATIAQAFEAHPWIRSTTRVTKAVGGKVAVDLVYRQPLAMVYCKPRPQDAQGPPQNIKEPGFFPVDTEGIMLPIEDFSQAQVFEYFWIMADSATPTGQIGMSFGDVRIANALKVCGLLEPERKRQKLQRVYVQHDHRSSGESPWILVLETTDKHQIIWGHMPDAEGTGEPSASEKLATLLAWLEAQRAAQTAGRTLNLLSKGSSPVSLRLP